MTLENLRSIWLLPTFLHRFHSFNVGRCAIEQWPKPWLFGLIWDETLDGRNPKQPPEMYKNLVNLGINYTYQLVSRNSSIISTTQLYGDYNKPLQGSLWTKQYNECHEGFERCSISLVFFGLKHCWNRQRSNERFQIGSGFVGTAQFGTWGSRYASINMFFEKAHRQQLMINWLVSQNMTLTNNKHRGDKKSRKFTWNMLNQFIAL